VIPEPFLDRNLLDFIKCQLNIALQFELREQMLKANAKNESNLERLSMERESIVRDLA
jgi:hypothetical protein